ncbi:MAG: hypothetical protein R2788_26495 [Saprospiraceae bacterium]
MPAKAGNCGCTGRSAQLKKREKLRNKFIILIITILHLGCANKSIDGIEVDFKNRQYEDVIENCNKILIKDSLNHEALILRGRAKTELREFEGAEQDIRKAIKINPKEPEYYCSLSYLMNKKGNFLLGKEFAEKTIEIDYDNFCGWTNKSWSDLELGNLEESFKESEKALILTRNLEDETEKSPIYANRAIILYEWGNIDESEIEAKKAVKFDSKSIEALIILAKVTAKKKNYSKAIELMNDAIKLDENYGLLYLNKGMIFLAMGKENEGCKWMKKGIKVNELYPHPYTKDMEKLENKYCGK